MSAREDSAVALDDDVKVLHGMGYAQELSRRLGRFSNFAISFSIICILAGGINSLAQATSGAGGAALGLGWPLGVRHSGSFGLAMAQIASAFPTAGGLYHWGSILGNRFTGWLTAWFNLLGLITVLGSINVGAYYFFIGAFGPALRLTDSMWLLMGFIAVLGAGQALINHYGISLTAKLTDFSGYLIFATAMLLAVVCLACAQQLRLVAPVDLRQLLRRRGRQCLAAGDAAAGCSCSGLLLPIYTITGYDASAHTSEETVAARRVSVPRGMVSSILWSGVFGYLFLVAFLLMIPDMDEAAKQGWNVFFWAMEQRVPGGIRDLLYALIFLSQVAVRPRDRDLHLANDLRLLARRRLACLQVPGAGLAHAPHAECGDLDRRDARAAVCLAARLARGRRHAGVHGGRLVHGDLPVLLVCDSHRAGTGRLRRTALAQDGPVEHGPRRLHAVCAAVDRVHGADLRHRRAAAERLALNVTVGFLVLTAIVWFAFERRRFQGPPMGESIGKRQAQIAAAEAALGRGKSLDIPRWCAADQPGAAPACSGLDARHRRVVQRAQVQLAGHALGRHLEFVACRASRYSRVTPSARRT